ncbi:phosphoacetylglucosamine mutase [Perkinsela sp. CCAP 1560/4]|nr:phosphoacetylglucosamine mutase [Perkinsela sp. CCAP 1560/4]|eukprot:KNH09551.1 phosphoacetylglucosamine mutase [Perkinsela sp. CCAP 1560/4]
MPPIEKDGKPHIPKYGTSGFRGSPRVILPIACRMTALMTIRCLVARKERLVKTPTSTLCGICFTASHNPPKDNGIKLIDLDGENIPDKWEELAGEMVRWSDFDAIQLLQAQLLKAHISEEDIIESKIALGRDSRPSGELLLKAACEVLDALQVVHVDCGLVTTPEMHFTMSAAFQNDCDGKIPPPVRSLGMSGPNYIDHLARVFQQLWEEKCFSHEKKWTFVVDCANGVGSLKFQNLQDKLATLLRIETVNTRIGDPECLNCLCGSDFVLESGKSMETFQSLLAPFIKHRTENALIFTSFDGDCDRLVCAVWVDGEFTVLGGDHLQALFVCFIRKLLSETSEAFSLAAVQTPYGNGNLTKLFCDDFGLDVKIVPPGVKNCHRQSLKNDIGVYFEANGHGSVTFSHKVRTILCQRFQKSNVAADRILYLVSNLFSQTCGDAIANMLCVPLALHYCGFNVRGWKGIFKPLPHASMRITLPRPVHIRTNWEQTRIVDPCDLQASIDRILDESIALQDEKRIEFAKALRCFVRPSGTEPILRVYVEGLEESVNFHVLDELARLLENYVKEFFYRTA